MTIGAMRSHLRLRGRCVWVPVTREGRREPLGHSLAATDQPAEVALTGDLVRPVRLTVAALLGWPQRRARVSFECATRGTRHHRFEGPLLHDVLSDAGTGFDPARRKDRLRFLIAITGADGHHALMTWAEIDPDFARAPVLLAVRIDGTPLDRAGPQLVLPQDRCGARHISGVTSIAVDGRYGGYGW
jgi:DMSO/TMAO reductase YedYZ molybdopterin-dependent catalytic subunit